MPRPPRIAVAGFQHETNTFAPVPTGFEDFLAGGGWPGLTEGAAVAEVFRPLNIPIGGFIQAAGQAAELHPILWTSAEPAAQVSSEAFDRIAGMILAGLRQAAPLDGVYLDLHGAMVTDTHPDGEGALLNLIRAELGAQTPIAVSLDLHANVSAALVELSDVITIYRTYPHLDMDLAGARAWAALAAILRTGRRPAKAFRQGTRLIPLSAQCTDAGPVAALYGALAELPPGVTADIALGFPLADVPDCGPALVAYGPSQEVADGVTDPLLAALEEVAATAPNPLISPAEAVARAISLTEAGGTVVVADVQDNSGAGAMADTTGLLDALLSAEAPRAVLGTLWDPAAAAEAHRAGEGQIIEITLGGRSGPPGVDPIPCRARVTRLSDGRFTCQGAMQRGVLTEIGPAARLTLEGPGALQVIVSSRRHQSIDQEVFRHLGVEPAAQRIVAVKSTVHFRADFAPIAREVLIVEA
ncbi:MAG: M81 family metallopeptidase, partial [Pseudomonadota bacterium]